MSQTATMSSGPSTTRAANPKDSMKSTWRGDKSTWGFWHYFLDILYLHPSAANRETPVHPKTDKVPYTPEWQQHRYVMLWAGTPLIVHQLYVWYTGQTLSLLAALAFYSVSYKLIGIHQFHQMRGMGHTYGFLDGDKHARDGVPDVSVGKVVRSLVSTSSLRSIMIIFYAYKANSAPADLNWKWLVAELGVYGIILDFWFYWYHRLMHEVDFLWQFHRTHHLTKHPNPLLTLYADGVQELFDIVGVPFATYVSMKLMGFPLGFYEWWICQQYVTFTELSGHSGLRIVANPPSALGWLLNWMDCELIIEDHDLHHRKGWKKSGNYGKQTRLWDKIFGTCIDRIECTPDNIDYENTVKIPLF